MKVHFDMLLNHDEEYNYWTDHLEELEAAKEKDSLHISLVKAFIERREFQLQTLYKKAYPEPKVGFFKSLLRALNPFQDVRDRNRLTH